VAAAGGGTEPFEAPATDAENGDKVPHLGRLRLAWKMREELYGVWHDA